MILSIFLIKRAHMPKIENREIFIYFKLRKNKKNEELDFQKILKKLKK
jgi:hypothetical protein